MKKNYILTAFFILSNSFAFSAELPGILNNIQEKALELTKNDYIAGKITAINDPDYLNDFTSHTQDHVLMVADKTLEIISVFEKAIELGTFQKDNTYNTNNQDYNRINFGTGIDKNTLVVASIFHDSGMKKGGFILDKEGKVALDEKGISKKATNGNDIRKNHALNSAINVLSQRKNLEKLGANVDFACLLCFAHSKSTSGVKDISRKSDWINAFDKLDRVVKVYNSENNNKISFNRQIFEYDEKLLSALATAALAIRLGDVSRDSGKHAKSQSGGEIVVYRSTVNSNADKAENEALNARVYNYRTGYVKGLFSRQVHVGEQNNVLNHTYIDQSGKVYHEMTIEDGNYAPYSTFQNVIEHCGELASAPDADIELHIIFNENPTEKYKTVYNKMRQSYYDENSDKAIKIIYCWN